MFWRRQSSAVHEVGQSLKRGYFHPPPPPQHLLRSRKTPRCFHCMILPPILHLQHTLPPSINAPNPPLHNNRNPAPPRGRVQQQGTDQSEVDRVHRVHLDLVPGLAVAASLRVGPQPDRKPVQVRNQSIWLPHRSEVLRSFLGMKPVGASMMFHTPPNEADVSQVSIPLLNISATDDEETCKRKAREHACRSDTDFTVWKEKEVNKGMKGIEEQDKMVNDYTDGKRKPKNPDTLGPPFPTWRNVGCFSLWLLWPILWGYVVFTAWTLMCLCLQVQSHWPLWSM